MDIQFTQNDYIVNVRSSGILIKNNSVLMHKSAEDSFWGPVGGKVKVNESSDQAVLREFKEELDADLQIDRLLLSAENFFVFNNAKYHEFTFVYLLKDKNHVINPAHTIVKTVDGHELTFRWFKYSELHSIEIKPVFLTEILADLPQSTNHIIYRD